MKQKPEEDDKELPPPGFEDMLYEAQRDRKYETAKLKAAEAAFPSTDEMACDKPESGGSVEEETAFP